MCCVSWMGRKGGTGPEEGQAATGRALGVQGGINQLRKCQSRTRCELRLSCCPGCARFLRHSRVLLVNLGLSPIPARMCWELQHSPAAEMVLVPGAHPMANPCPGWAFLQSPEPSLLPRAHRPPLQGFCHLKFLNKSSKSWLKNQSQECSSSA